MARIRIGLAITALVIIGGFVGGCEEGQATNSPPDVKMQRLFAAENEQLKSENEKLKGNIEQLKQQLEQCDKQRQDWQNKAQTEIKESIDGILKAGVEQNAALNNEIEQLKEEIAKLKGQQPAEQQPAIEQPKENEPNTTEEKPKML
jgi:polyhydroxyalkanoate synthesis regulator phasin